MPFVLMLAILVVIVWRVLAHNYAERLASKDGIIQLRDAQLADYKDKLNGATPEAAKANGAAKEPPVLADALNQAADALMKRFMGPKAG